MGRFVIWGSNGRSWVCNLCGASTETPNAYYAQLDENNHRTDRYERAELSQGSLLDVSNPELEVRTDFVLTFLIF